jgi:hypothetical protein
MFPFSRTVSLGLENDINVSNQSKKKKQAITHTVETVYVSTCEKCHKIFPDIVMCQRHISTEHKDLQLYCKNVTKELRKVYICRVCPGKENRMFSNMTRLSQHIRSKHNITPCSIPEKHHQTGEKSVEVSQKLDEMNLCARLAMSKKLKTVVVLHRLEIAPEQMYTTINLKHFNRNQSKKKHQSITHTVERKYISTCLECHKIFPKKDFCYKHIRRQHKDLHYQNLCSDVFSTLRTVYICRVCTGKEKIFFNMTLLTQHIRYKHKMAHCSTFADTVKINMRKQRYKKKNYRRELQEREMLL